MHMSDALLSPAIGGAMWVVSAGVIAYCSRKVNTEADDSKVPLMGVMGAFVFAAQMVNFTIPATGSSGHIGGGLLLTILLGPHAAFLVISSVLLIQAFFFADGGLLALGCNIFNLGFFPAFIAYPLVYRPVSGKQTSGIRATTAAIIASALGLQLGAFSAVLETVASGISALPFTGFLFLMQPIHLAIGICEGIATALVVSFIIKARPGALFSHRTPVYRFPSRAVIFSVLLATMLLGGVFSRFASEKPDGLEWAIVKVAGESGFAAPTGGIHGLLAHIQRATSILPDYTLSTVGKENSTSHIKPGASLDSGHAGTSISGLIGGLLALSFSLIVGYVLSQLQKRPQLGSR